MHVYSDPPSDCYSVLSFSLSPLSSLSYTDFLTKSNWNTVHILTPHAIRYFFQQPYTHTPLTVSCYKTLHRPASVCICVSLLHRITSSLVRVLDTYVITSVIMSVLCVCVFVLYNTCMINACVVQCTVGVTVQLLCTCMVQSTCMYIHVHTIYVCTCIVW